MVRLRVKSSLQKTPALRTPFRHNAPLWLLARYATVYDAGGSLHIFYVDQMSGPWTVIHYVRTGPQMEWLATDTACPLQRFVPPSVEAPIAYVDAILGSDDVIYVGVASSQQIIVGTLTSGTLTTTWIEPSGGFLGNFIGFQAAALSMAWDDRPGNLSQGPVLCYGFNNTDQGGNHYAPIAQACWPHSGVFAHSGDAQPVVVFPFDQNVYTDVEWGAYLDPAVPNNNGEAVYGVLCNANYARLPLGTETVIRLNQNLQAPASSVTPANTCNTVQRCFVFLRDRASPKKPMAPLFLGVHIADAALDLSAPQGATQVVFMPNDQYQAGGPPETVTLLFQDPMSPVNFAPWSWMPQWIDVVIQDLSGNTTSGPAGTWMVEGTNFRVHVFALFRSADRTTCRLLHTWSFDAGGAGGGGVVETSPGVFDVPAQNWSCPVVVTTDISNNPFSTALFRNTCTVTVVNAARGLNIWTQDLSPASGALQWTSSDLTTGGMNAVPAGQALPDFRMAPSMYMELAAVDEDATTRLNSPRPGALAHIGSNHTMHLTVNGNHVTLSPQAVPSQVVFNSAGLLGIEMPLVMQGSNSEAVFSYPVLIPPTCWISFDDGTSTVIDLLMTPPEIFSTFSSGNFTSQGLASMQAKAPPPGVKLASSYFDPNSANGVVGSILGMASTFFVPAGTSALERNSLSSDSLGMVNVGVRLKNQPISIGPITNTTGDAAVRFRISFTTTYYRSPAGQGILKTDFADLKGQDDQALMDATGTGLPQPFSCADLFQNVLAAPEGHIKSITVDCTGQHMLAKIVWSYYNPHAASDSTRAWVGRITSTHEIGLLFSVILSYAGLFGNTIAAVFDKTPLWRGDSSITTSTGADVAAWANKISPLIQSAGDIVKTFNTQTFPALDDDLMKKLFGGRGGKGITDLFASSATLFGAYNGCRDDDDLIQNDTSNIGTPACLVPANPQIPASSSWLFCQYIDTGLPLLQPTPPTAAFTASHTAALAAVKENLENFNNAGVLDDLVGLWNTITSYPVFDQTPLSTILPGTTAALINSVAASAGLRSPLAALLRVVADDGAAALARPPASGSLLYQVLTTPSGQPAPSVAVKDLLALVLAAPMKAVHDLLVTESNVTDRPFIDAGLTALVGTYYGVSGAVAPPTQYFSKPLLSLAINTIIAKQLVEDVPASTASGAAAAAPTATTDLIVPPYLPLCYQADVALSAFQCMVADTVLVQAPPPTPEDEHYLTMYLAGLTAYGFFTAAVSDIAKRGKDLAGTLDQDRLPLGHALWRGLGGLSNLVRLAAIVDADVAAGAKAAAAPGGPPMATPPAPRAALSAGLEPAWAAMWCACDSAACGYLAGYSRSLQTMTGFKRKKKPPLIPPKGAPDGDRGDGDDLVAKEG